MLPDPRLPDVTREDVIRIARRDFPHEQIEVVLSQLDRYGDEEWQPERDRIQLAILKLSRGDLSKLGKYVREAQADFREVAWPAEYPIQFEYSWRYSIWRNVPSELLDADWEQYTSWLQSVEHCGGPEVDLIGRSNVENFFREPPIRRRGVRVWAFPIVGAVVVMLSTLAIPANQKPSLAALACYGATLGLVAGMLLWLNDQFAWRKRRRKRNHG